MYREVTVDILLLVLLLAFSGYNMTSKSHDSPLTYHRIIEAFKFAYAWRARLDDPAFNFEMNEVTN